MERINSERIRNAEQHAHALLRSLEELKEGSIKSYEDSSSYMRESLPRKVKDYRKDQRSVESPLPSTDFFCFCGNTASGRCSTNKCFRCCTDPYCDEKRHRRQMKNYERRKRTNYYEGDHSSDEDVPLYDMRKRKLSDRRDSSPSSDEDWTPNRSKGKKKLKGRGNYRDGSHIHEPSQQSHPSNSLLPSLIRIPTVTHHVPSSSRSSSSSHHHNPPPVLSAVKQQKPIWNPTDLRMPLLTTMLTNASSHKSRGYSQPSSSTVRLPMISSSGLYSKHHLLSPTFNGIPTTPSELTRKMPLPVTSKYNTLHHSGGSNLEKRPINTQQHEIKEEDHILMFYVRYPYSQYCDQSRMIDLFRPYCHLRHIQWLDKRSAYVTISHDATFQTYDFIWLNLVMKSDYENNNMLYVCPYTDYLKKKNGDRVSKIKTEKEEMV